METPYFNIKYPYVCATNVFTPEELTRIEQMGDMLEQGVAGVAKGQHHTVLKSRITRTAWIDRTPAANWLYERIERTAQMLNAQTFQYDLRGFSDPFQYTVYHGVEGGHYDWHVDMMRPTGPQRKLSFSLQLTDPSQYEGCDLQFLAGDGMETAPRERGALVAFPSFVLHRVTPVIVGTRKSLVVWASGPGFR
jgi:PKHD-type hydroxylase